MSSVPRPFQKETVDAAVDVLRGRGRRRFLVADEVGLGKTVVAREILRELSEQSPRKFVVYYVTSNTRVSDQNAKRLVDFLGEAAPAVVSKVDRLGLIPLDGSPARGLRLYPLSPITSFPPVDARPQTGKVGERAFLLHMLDRCYPGISKAMLSNFLQQRATASWDNALKRARPLARQVPVKFVTAYRRALVAEFGRNARRRIEESVWEAVRQKKAPLRTLARLRRPLAEACLLAMPPDLVILDEFQRFRDLLSPAVDDRLVQALVNGPKESRPPPLLLLSATPYRTFGETWDSGSAGASHIDLLDLIDFLGGGNTRETSQKLFAEFGRLLRSIARNSSAGAESLYSRAACVRDEIEALLRPLIARTERSAHLGGTSLTEQPTLDLEAGDLHVFRHLAEALPQKLRSWAVPYWLSIPLPAQSMGKRYALTKNVEFKPARNVPAITLKRRARSLGGWGNPKLRELGQMVPQSELSLPWTAPSLSWWPLRGAWAVRPAPKALLFSRFRAAPQSAAALISLELERRFASPGDQSYEEAWKRRKLQPKASQGSTLALFHPSPLLIALDPLSGRHGSSALALQTVRQQLGKRLRAHAMEVKRHPSSAVRRHLPLWQVLAAAEKKVGCFERAQAAWSKLSVSDLVLRDLLERRERVEPLEWLSPREVQDLAMLALGGPANVAGRAWRRHWDEANSAEGLVALARFSWRTLRPYLDNPIFWGRLGKGKPAHLLLSAVIDGGLESVFDEHFWVGRSRVEPRVLIDDLAAALGAMTGWFTFRRMTGEDGGVRVRCHAAVPFGGTEAVEDVVGDDSSRPARSHELRRAFNTPFWPHILASTSAGQEGLDFHSWCERIVHWDLPSNAIDLEQREGRISRFAGLVIRRALADEVGERALRCTSEEGGSPWCHLESLAEQSHCDASGLSPWWLLEGAAIRRTVLSLPQSRDVERFRRLQRQRLLYRLALGQPDQEDLVEMMSRADDEKIDALVALTINLSPFFSNAQQFETSEDRAAAE